MLAIQKQIESVYYIYSKKNHPRHVKSKREHVHIVQKSVAVHYLLKHDTELLILCHISVQILYYIRFML